MMIRHLRFLWGLMLLGVFLSGAAWAQPTDSDVQLNQGIQNLQMGNVDEALVNFQTAWNIGPKTAPKAFYLGVAHFRLTQFTEALNYMERAISLDPKFHEARLQLAASYLALNNPAAALPHLQELEAVGYKPAQTALLLGQAAAQQQRHEAAVSHFRQAAQEPVLAQEAKIQEGMALSSQDKFKDARQALEAAISLNPTSREAGFAQRYVESINRRIQDTKPLHIRLGASFDYDSNVTLTPGDVGAANIVPIGGRDAVFTQFGNFEYDFFPTGPYGLVASYNLFMTWHARLTLYDVMSHTFGLNPSYRMANGTFWLPFRFNYTDLDSNKYWTSFTLTPTYLHMLKPDIGIEAGLRLVRNYYWWLQPFPQEDRSSKNIGGNLGLYYFFKKQQGYLQSRFSYEYADASGTNWTASIYSLLLSALYPVNDSLRLNPSVELISQPFENRWFNGATYQAKRRDKSLVLGLQVLYKCYKSIDLNLHYYYIRNDSNTPLYDYDRQIAGLLIEYRY